MDNASVDVLNRKCNRFQQLYNGWLDGRQYCIGTNVQKEYMCPLVSQGRIEEQSQHKWFSQQSKCHNPDAKCQCHRKMPLLGKYHLCSNQSEYSHYQEDPFQRGSFAATGAPPKNQPSKGHPSQKGGYVFTTQEPSSQEPAPRHSQGEYCQASRDPYTTYPAQQGYYVKRCVGDRNLYPGRQMQVRSGPDSGSTQWNQPIPPLAHEMTIQSSELPGKAPIGWSSAMNNLVVNQSPEEQTNRFIMDQTISPGVTVELQQQHIGKRPVYGSRVMESDVPQMLLQERANLAGTSTSCTQPTWKPCQRCI